LRRWDDWTNLLQKVLRALFFFHPALWWVDRRLALEREMACDDVVIAATHDAHAYATCLVDIAEKSLLRRSLALAQAAVHGVGHMSLRVTEILDSSRPRTTRTSKLALGGTAMLAIASLAAVVNSPTLISLTASKPAVEDARSSTDIPAIAPGFDNARVTPVAFHQEVRHPRPAPKRQLAARRVQPKAFVAALNANSLAQQGNRGKLQEASWAAQSAAVPVETMLVLMPDVRFDSTGRVLCTWSLWRLTVFQPAQAMVEDTRIPKSI
jgi:hypothetical protein